VWGGNAAGSSHSQPYPIRLMTLGTPRGGVRRDDLQKMANAQEYNFDHPNAFDADEIVHCLKLLKTGEPVEVPEYCFKTHQRLSITRLINPSDVIIFEGILLFQVRCCLTLTLPPSYPHRYVRPIGARLRAFVVSSPSASPSVRAHLSTPLLTLAV